MIDSIVNFIINLIIGLFVIGLVLSIFGPLAYAALLVICTPFVTAYRALRQHQAHKPRVVKEVVFDEKMIKDEATRRAYDRLVAEEEQRIVEGA